MSLNNTTCDSWDCLFELESNWTLCSHSESNLKEPEYFSPRYALIGTIFQGIIFVIGVLGNIMVVVVVTQVRALHTPTNCYLVSLAIADTVVLVASVPNEILSYYLVGNQWIWGEIGCNLFIFCQNLGINSSALCLVAFTVERYIAICHPMKAHKICTPGRAKKITLGVWIVAIIYCSPWLGLTTTQPLNYRGYPEVRECVFKRPRNEYLVIFFTDLILFYVFPLIISCVLYSLIAHTLMKRCTRSSQGQLTTSISNECSKIQSSKSQVVKMLAVVVAVFAVLWLPFRGLLVYNSFASLFQAKPFLDLWFLMFAKTCVYINSAINPILYNAMSIKFRRAFHRLLVCWGTQPLSSSHQATTLQHVTSTHIISQSSKSSLNNHGCSKF